MEEIFRYSHLYWIIIVGLTALFFILKAIKFYVKMGIDPNDIKIPIFFFGVIILPNLCFLVGKDEAISIYKGQQYKKVKIINNKDNHANIDTTSFKLLGFLGDKLIVSSFDNKKIFVINEDSYTHLEMEEVDNREK